MLARVQFPVPHTPPSTTPRPRVPLEIMAGPRRPPAAAGDPQDDFQRLARPGSSIPLRAGLPPPSPDGSLDGTALSPTGTGGNR